MARFLCTVWPFPGHLYPIISVAHALRARGHTVGIYSGGSARPIVEGEGFDYFPFERLAARLGEIVDGGRHGVDDAAFYERLSARYSRSYEQKGAARGQLLKVMYREWILGTVPEQVADMEAIMQNWPADAVLCDPLVWGPILVLGQKHALPVVPFSFFAGCLIPGPDVPVAGLGLPRPRNPYARMLNRAVSFVVDRLTADLRREANGIRGRYGLPALTETVTASTGRLPLYLVSTSPEFDYRRRDLPASVHYVGTCLWDRPNSDPAPQWLEKLPRDRPVVYVTEGTSQVRDPVLLRAAVQGLANLPISVVVTTGRHRTPRSLVQEPPAPNIRVEQFVPHSHLFPRLSAVVTNGGSGTVRGALSAGLPLVIVPMEWDQFENARRVSDAGAGLRLDVRRCTPGGLRGAVQRILLEPSFRANARRLGAASDRCGGPQRAAELLEGIVPLPAASLPVAEPGRA